MDDPVFETDTEFSNPNNLLPEQRETTEITEFTTEENLLCDPPESEYLPLSDGEEKHSINRAVIFSRLLALFFCSVALLFYFHGIKVFLKQITAENLKAIPMQEVFGGYFLLEKKSVLPTETEDDSIEEVPEKNDENQNDAETFPIEQTNLSAAEKDLFKLNNQTDFSVDTKELLERDDTLPLAKEIYDKFGKSAPVVLIMHTHGTEAYSEDNESYNTDSPFRSNDESNNVVAIGSVMTEVFEKAGINVIHDTTMYDRESYKDSYNRSRKAVSEHLTDHPSITYIFDVHRDAIIKEDKTAIAPISTYGEHESAQVMLVVGTNQDGADHEDWRLNLSFALKVQKELFGTNETLPRNINLRTSAFNQGLSRGSLLLEVGSCGNTLLQAKRCAVLTAVSLTKVINGKEHPTPPEELFRLYVTEN